MTGTAREIPRKLGMTSYACLRHALGNSALQQTHHVPHRHAGDDGEQAQRAVQDSDGPRLSVLEEPPIQLLMDRLIDRALVWQEETAGPHQRHDRDHPWVDAQARGDRRERDREDRKSTRLNSSHGSISYAVFCLKKKKKR